MFRKFIKSVIPKGLFKNIEPLGHGIEAVLANIRYGFPAQGLNVIGVTGTNGKTTVSTMVYTMLNDAGIKTGLTTTIGWGTPDNWHEQVVHMTTERSFPLMRRIRDLRREGIEWLVLETTSHALAQNRVWGIPYQIAVMTNVTHEHLDYHGTFENYRDAKVKLFKLADKHGRRAGIVNADDPSAGNFAAVIKNVVTYGIEKGELRATEVKSTPAGSDFTVKGTKIHTNLPGDFNVYNALATAAVGQVLDLTPDQITHGIAALKTVEGRMNTVDVGQDFDVIIDYAHTPDSFEKLFKGIKPSVKGRLIVMFGSAGGQRDPAKRPIQGELAGKYADIVVLTEEDDRDTPGMEILNQIADGAEKAGKVRDKDLFLVLDRVEAIQSTVNQAKAGDTVLFLGKGHEKTIERADGEHPWDEPGEVRKALRQRFK